jgi:hypothetical protein
MQNPKTLVSFGFQQIKGNFRRGLGLLIEKIGSQIAIHTSVQNTLFVVGTAMHMLTQGRGNYKLIV